MLARGGVGLVRVTPHRTEQGGVRPDGQRQHDGEDSCAKHGTLTKEEARFAPVLIPNTKRETTTFLTIMGVEHSHACGISLMRCRNSPTRPEALAIRTLRVGTVMLVAD
jgi:hypothetical protein